MCCLPACAQGSSAAVSRIVGDGAFLGIILGVPWSLVHMGCAGVAGTYSSYLQYSGYGGVPIAGHALLGGGRWEHYLRDPQGVHTSLHKSAPHVFR